MEPMVALLVPANVAKNQAARLPKVGRFNWWQASSNSRAKSEESYSENLERR